MRALGSTEFDNSDDKLSARLRARLHRYTLEDGLLYYSTGSDDPPRVAVPHDEDLKYRILYEAHDTPVAGHLGREKTYNSVSSHYWCPIYISGLAHTCARARHASGLSPPHMRLRRWQVCRYQHVVGRP